MEREQDDQRVSDETVDDLLVLQRWSVNLEAAGTSHEPGVDRTMLLRLLEVLAEFHPSVGSMPYRYSARFTIDAPDAVEALARATAVWGHAIREAGLPDWPVVRCEAHAKPS